jgi:hypothetical protein
MGSSENLLHTTAQKTDYLLLALNGFLESGSMDIGLGGNAPTVQAGASHFVLFYDNHLQALLGCIFCCPISARTGTYDDKISIHSGCWLLAFSN